MRYVILKRIFRSFSPLGSILEAQAEQQEEYQLQLVEYEIGEGSLDSRSPLSSSLEEREASSPVARR